MWGISCKIVSCEGWKGGHSRHPSPARWRVVARCCRCLENSTGPQGCDPDTDGVGIHADTRQQRREASVVPGRSFFAWLTAQRRPSRPPPS
eukprot:scaffold61002_cov64-Phaeocystis_antarctica.AAC.6